MPTKIIPTLIIGLGGTGTMAVSAIKSYAMQHFLEPSVNFPLIRFLTIDTEFITEPSADRITKIRQKYSHTTGLDSSYEETHEISLKPNEKAAALVDKDTMRGWLANPVDLGADDFVAPEYMEEVVKAVQGNGAGGFGIVGKLALWGNRQSIIQQIRTILQGLLNTTRVNRAMKKPLPDGTTYRDRYEPDFENGINVIVICSVGGGTGKGMFFAYWCHRK